MSMSGSLVDNSSHVASQARLTYGIWSRVRLDGYTFDKFLVDHVLQITIVEMRESSVPQDKIQGSSTGVESSRNRIGSGIGSWWRMGNGRANKVSKSSFHLSSQNKRAFVMEVHHVLPHHNLEVRFHSQLVH